MQPQLHFSLRPPATDNGGDDSTPLLARDSWRAAKRARFAAQPSSSERNLVLTNLRVLDACRGLLSSFGHSVTLQGGLITALDTAVPPADAVVLDCAGLTLLPGLCDAHVHVTACSANLASLYGLPESLVAARASEVLEGMLARGFTTVRDAGGADWGLAQAVEEGTLLGPTILFAGHALSQTGGHGDFRGRGEEVCACGSALRGIGRVCDGVDACRAAARDELRKGAHCIKVMASGGVSSPTDRLENTQFSLEELTAIVEEAGAAGTYVMAHAYKPTAIRRAVAAGVRSIEHGNWLDRETAELMAGTGTWLVPTTVTYQALQREGAAAGMAPELVAKVGAAVAQGQASMALARAAGVRMAFGSDLLGALHRFQSDEFLLRAEAGLPAVEILQAATCNAAALFNKQGRLGEVAVGAAADLLLLEGDPLSDIGLLARPEAIRMVIKDGLLAKVPHLGLLGVNRLIVPGSGGSSDARR